MPDLKDITDPTEFIPEPSTPWWIWAIVAGAVLLVVAIILFFILRKSPQQQKKSSLERARKKLTALRDEAAILPPQTLATRISVIIRRYLETAYEDPALFETNEEFQLRENALQNLPTNTREAFVSHLNALSNCKYIPQSELDPDEVFKDAYAVLDLTD